MSLFTEIISIHVLLILLKDAIADFEFYKFLNFHCSGDYETTTYYTSSTTTEYYIYDPFYTSTSTSTSTTTEPY